MPSQPARVNPIVNSFASVIVPHSCILGGALAVNDEQLFEIPHGAMVADAAGGAIGRNIWQHAQPERSTREA